MLDWLTSDFSPTHMRQHCDGCKKSSSSKPLYLPPPDHKERKAKKSKNRTDESQSHDLWFQANPSKNFFASRPAASGSSMYGYNSTVIQP